VDAREVVSEVSEETDREEREEETAESAECGQGGGFAYAIMPVDGAFRPDSRANGFSVAPFCDSYGLVAPETGTGAQYGGLTFVTGDFWMDLEQSRSQTPTPALRARFGLEGPGGGSAAGGGQP
jgi:hypothetical protein